MWWNRLFRLDVVAVKGTADEQGWTKDRITKRGSNALPIRAARYRWEASDAGRLQRIHRIILDAAEVEIISDEMRAVVESLLPELAHKLPHKHSYRDGLKLRPTGLGSGIDKDRADYTVCTGAWEVGRIYRTRGGPDNLRWFWSLTVTGPMTRSDRPWRKPKRARLHAGKVIPSANAAGRDEVYRGLRT